MRKALKLTQSELAAKTAIPGVTKDTISRIERGERAPNLELALALARVLGVPAEVLFTLPTDQEVAA